MLVVLLEVWAALATVLAGYFHYQYRIADAAGFRLFTFIRVGLGYSVERLNREMEAFEDNLAEGAN